jgi:MGT family glycosyltransferase
MNHSRALNFLFTTFDGGGNVAPIMAPIEELVARGHRVRVMSDRMNRDEAEAVGARFVSWTRAPSKPFRSRETDGRDWAAATPEEGLREMVEHFLCGTALAYAQDLNAELDREAADLVVNFDMVFGVMTGCEARSQRLASLSTCISMFPLPGIPPFGAGLAPARTESEQELHAHIAAGAMALFDTGLSALNSARAALGLEPLAHVLDQANAAYVRFLGTAQAFDFPSNALPANVRYVGPLIRDPVWMTPWVSPWSAADTRPLVVVGFSTSFQNHAACLQRVIDASADFPVRLLVTLGGAIRKDELRAAPNAVLVDSAPHSVVMREASIVVTHGGHGTVMTALMHRVPLLVIPHGRDQGDNAVRITERGAGLSLPSAAATEEMHAALKRLLTEPRFRVAARRLGDAVAAEAEHSTLIAELEALAVVPTSTSREHTAMPSAAAK